VNASKNSFLSKAFTGPVVYMHDQRLASPSMQYFSHDQVDALYKDIKCPVILLTAGRVEHYFKCLYNHYFCHLVR